jgi:hypothetical protein
MSGAAAQPTESSAERAAARGRRIHPRVLVAIGLLGHGWTLALLLVIAVPTGAVIERLVGPLPVPAFFMVLLVALSGIAAVRVRIEPPAGLRLPPNLSPALHELIDAVRAPLRAPAYADVLMGTGLDLRTMRVPRLGGLRGFDEYLVIGLPLMTALPVEHLRALIAHELAHRSRHDGVRGARIHRLRQGWLDGMRAVSASRGPAAATLRPFHRWFAPLYARLTFLAAADHEMAADRRAAQVTGRDDFAGALLRLHVVERFLVERFYPRMLTDLRHFGVPPTGLCGRLERAVEEIRVDTRFNAWVDAAMRREPENADTHASLRRRLSARAIADVRAGTPCVVDMALSPDHAGMSAARLCLAANPEALMVSIEKAWTDAVQSELAGRHEELLRLDERRRELEKRIDLTPTQMLEHAIATAETDGDAAAIPVLRSLVERHPELAPARFVLGTLLLRANEEEGLVHIHTATRIDPSLDAHGRELAADFLRANEDRVVDAVLPCTG